MNIIFLILIIHFRHFTASVAPNIVLILTDDQDVVLGGLTPLKKTKNLIQKKGVNFFNAFSTTPICCPSRSSILSGLYLHSHNVVNNTYKGGCSDIRWQKEFEPNTFGSVLQNSNYNTFYAGKYLNRYGFKPSGGVKHVPKGWNWWIGLKGNSVYYNYTLSVNGTAVTRGCAEEDYLTDVLQEYSLMFLNQRSIRNKPFLMVVSPPSPHEPFTPAKRHLGKFSGSKAPRTPNFNLPINKTKHWLLRLPPSTVPGETVEKIDEVFKNRWESLLAVDDLVEAIVNKLKTLKILNNTFIIFTSDHGFHLNQFALPWDKRQPYETDIRIPLLIRGPGIPSNKIQMHPVLNIDIAPTILDIVGVDPAYKMDGMSFLSFATSEELTQPSRGFLIEYHGEQEQEHNTCYNDPEVKECRRDASCKCFDARNNTYTCLRYLSEKIDDKYCIFQDLESFIEYYNIKEDPYEIINLGGGDWTKIHELVLSCCKRNIKLKKSIDNCFEYLSTQFSFPEIIHIL